MEGEAGMKGGAVMKGGEEDVRRGRHGRRGVDGRRGGQGSRVRLILNRRVEGGWRDGMKGNKRRMHKIFFDISTPPSFLTDRGAEQCFLTRHKTVHSVGNKCCAIIISGSVWFIKLICSLWKCSSCTFPSE